MLQLEIIRVSYVILYFVFSFVSVPKSQPLIYAQIPFYLNNMGDTEAITACISVSMITWTVLAFFLIYSFTDTPPHPLIARLPKLSSKIFFIYQWIKSYNEN